MSVRGHIWVLLIFISILAFIIFISPVFLFVLPDDNIKMLGMYNPNVSDIFVFLISKLSNWGTIFSPVGVFFSGLSALGSFYLIYLQLKTIKEEKNSTQKSIFSAWISQMFLFKHNMLKSVTFVDDNVASENIFRVLSNIIDKSFLIYIKKSNEACISNSAIECEIYNNIYNIVCTEDSIEIMLRMLVHELNRVTKFTLNVYFYNIYTTLKMINDNNMLTQQEKDTYILMYCSQFTQQELKVIYMHALIPDANNELKLKKLIEETGFFRSFNEIEMPFRIISEKFPGFGYSASAFRS